MKLGDCKVRKLDTYKSGEVENIPDLLRLKEIQELWNSEEVKEGIGPNKIENDPNLYF